VVIVPNSRTELVKNNCSIQYSRAQPSCFYEFLLAVAYLGYGSHGTCHGCHVGGCKNCLEKNKIFIYSFLIEPLLCTPYIHKLRNCINTALLPDRLMQWFPTGVPRQPTVPFTPRVKTFFSVSLKIHLENVIKPQSKLLCVHHRVPQIFFAVGCRNPKKVG